MGKIWKIISSTDRMGGGGPPLEEYFLVAITDRDAAVTALRYRRPDVEASAMNLVGEATADDIKWLDLKEGQILCLQPVS
jgi:hypothetical protein